MSVVLLIAGVSYMHYKGYDRSIARRIFFSVQRKSVPANKSDSYYSGVFNDLNNRHLSSAKKLGIKRPLKNRAEAEGIKGGLVKIKSNAHYKVDNLTHSIPYLTGGAAELLDMIGKNFQDSLESKGLPSGRIIVTSVLRTQDDIKRLQKSGNPNSSSNSAHCYGTTFDITYIRYDKTFVAAGTLKKVLGEVLLDLKKRKKCYVKYEIKQRCFHITARI